jgi:microcystin-dependent protein
MPNFDIPKQYQDEEDLTEAILDASFEYIETFLNTTKLDSDNIQTGGIATLNIAASAVTAAKLASDSVTTVKILDSNVTTAKIADLNVTLGKLAASIQASLNPTGTVIAFAGSTAPTGFLECDGAAVSRTTYADLFTVIGETHGQGDNVTTFNVPDYRGRFLRGYDHGAGNDPDAASRTAMATGGNTGDSVGSIQDDAFEAHTHTVQDGSSTSDGSIFDAASGSVERTNNTGSTGGNETRPKNAFVMFCIKT